MTIATTARPKARLIFKRLTLLALACAWLSSCAPLASVKRTTPGLSASFASNHEPSELREARLGAVSAQKLVELNPKQAIIDSATAARLSLAAMDGVSGSQAKQAMDIYNFSVARLIDAVNQSKQQPWKGPINLEEPNGSLWLTMTTDSLSTWNPATDKLEAADRMILGGQYIRERVSIPGVGAPLVSIGPGRTDSPWVPLKHFVPATALAYFSGNRVTIRVVNPYATTAVQIAGKTRPVAADLSAPLAVNIVTTHPELFGILALLNASKYQKDDRLVMMEPYRPGVQPVIFIHGLADSPLSWVPEINAMNGNAELRSKYQIWYFQYSSAAPYPIPAEILREQLAAVYQKYPQTPKAVLVGHSMGGLIAHMLMCDSGTQFSEDILGKTVAQLNLPPSANIVRGALQFKASPCVAKVIFEAAPHRGANMAKNPLGRIGSMLVRLPINMVKMGPGLISDARARNGDRVIDHFPNSIDTFRPKALVILAMDKLPLNPGVPYYSIIGDAGLPGNKLKSTDLVVPYWSSHLDGAKSEKMVPYWHSEVLMGPDTIAEVQRILLEN